MKACLFFYFFLLTQIAFSQKIPYIPAYLLDTNTVDGKQFSWNKTTESGNFILIWGNTVGTDPASYSDPDLAFNPQEILDTLEYIFQRYKEIGFADDQSGTNLGIYKIPVVMYNTWGPDGAQGYANGGDADGVIGAFWVHPIAMHGGHVAAHELTHSLQAQVVIDYRAQQGLGPVWNHAGIFWETHANFMRNLLYPQDVTAWGMDVYHIETWGDWKNTYENYEWLLALNDLPVINRMWRESYSNEYPLQAYKRLKNYTQAEFNDRMYLYAKRMVGFDFNNFTDFGFYFLQYRKNDLQNYLLSTQAAYTILRRDPDHPTHYQVPIELAPEEYAYNIIPIYPDPDSCSIFIKFKGHTEVNPHAGWRYGFVGTYEDGRPSTYYDVDGPEEAELEIKLLPFESKLYMVIMGAPKDSITTNESNDTWHGYPKHFRYPYELNITGGVPEGYQEPDSFRAQLKLNGHHHSNGGGWIDNNSSVDPSVFVGPYAIVQGNAVITGNVKLLNTSFVRDAHISGDVIIKDNAFVTDGTFSDSALVKGQAFLENATLWDKAEVNGRAHVSNYKLHGDIEVGGDVIVYNQDGDCDNGVYYRLTNYYDDKLLECDGRTADHPDNKDVNHPVQPFMSNELDIKCTCNTYPGCLAVGTKDVNKSEGMMLFPNPAHEAIYIYSNEDLRENSKTEIINSFGQLIRTGILSDNKIDISDLDNGVYFLKIYLQSGRAEVLKFLVL